MSSKKKKPRVKSETNPKKRTCTECGTSGGRDGCGFYSRPDRSSGWSSLCKECHKDNIHKRDVERRKKRFASNYSSLKPEDFAVRVGNKGPVDRKASQEKRQEWSEAMGKFADGLAQDELDGDDGEYMAQLAEQERRFGNRRIARTVSLAAAHEALALKQFKVMAEQYFKNKVTPTGYALKKNNLEIKRDVINVLSDLHLGADLDAKSNPIPFRAVEEARRLEYVLRQVLDYKPQYRSHSRLRLVINGDVIEGFLLKDMRSGLPLAEQQAVFFQHMRTYLGMCAQQYPEVEVEFQPGNHGRDIARHPGRATESKWDGIEWRMYYALMLMCSGLKNVKWSLPFQAVSRLDLFGQMVLVTHGDTEVKVGDPDTKAAQNSAELDKINASREYGCEFVAAIFGHFHKSRNQAGNVIKIFNGCLVPPNGYARGSGYIGEPCSQTIFEAVEGHPVGDYRRIEVGPAQDSDERLGTIIKPFRLHDDMTNAAEVLL